MEGLSCMPPELRIVLMIWLIVQCTKEVAFALQHSSWILSSAQCHCKAQGLSSSGMRLYCPCISFMFPQDLNIVILRPLWHRH